MTGIQTEDVPTEYVKPPDFGDPRYHYKVNGCECWDKPKPAKAGNGEVLCPLCDCPNQATNESCSCCTKGLDSTYIYGRAAEKSPPPKSLRASEIQVWRKYQYEGWLITANGAPDFMAMNEQTGEVRAIEVKTDYSPLSPSQTWYMQMLRRAGVKHVVERVKHR